MQIDFSTQIIEISIRYDLERLNGILKRYQTEKNRQIETSGQGSEELEEKINDCYVV